MLNDALASAGLASLQQDMDEDDVRITLDTQIATGGNNLSIGQRQILALARAMLRNSKMIIMDEATSAIGVSFNELAVNLWVDYKTDAVIQDSLQNELGRDVTVITVAHRLSTILGGDKIVSCIKRWF